MDEKRGKGIPFVKGSETSADAADSMMKASGNLRWKVLQFIEKQGLYGATDEEIQEGLDMSPNTQRPRRRELESKGFVCKRYRFGDQMKRTTRSGRKAGVYISQKLHDPLHNPVIQAIKPITTGRKHLISKLDSLEFQLGVLSTELRTGEEVYDSTEVIEEEMKKIIALFTNVVDAGRIFWKEVARSREDIQ